MKVVKLKYKLESLVGVHTHTHTDSFREIKIGKKAFIRDIKMIDYK